MGDITSVDGDHPVWIGLLGPLELRVDGRSIDVKGPRRRAILAILGAAAGRTVTTDTLLADAFYDVESPQPNTLHVHISQLRSLFAPHGNALERQGSGYRLSSAICTTDAAELDQAVIAVKNRRSQPALARLRAALDDWRGDFCSDVPLSALESRRTFYRGLRLDASELLFDAELQQGSGADLPDQIEAVITADPLRERLWGQLMLALFVAGRQSDALAAYRRARTALAELGGLDPGPALRELEALILSQADSIGGVPSAAPVSSAPTLVWLDAGGVLRSRPLLGDSPVVIGRATDCDIRIDWDPMVSRRHVSVGRTPDGFEVRDLGSTNGCYVDGERVETASELPVRGTLQIGDTVLFLRGPTQRVGSRQLTSKAKQLSDEPPA